MFKSRVDKNQKEIAQAFKSLGYSVAYIHTLKSGIGDIIVGKHEMNFIIEIKDGKAPPSKKKLTDKEKEFKGSWKGQHTIIESIEEVIKFNDEIS